MLVPVEVVKKACLKPGRGSRSRLQYRSWAATCQRTIYLSPIHIQRTGRQLSLLFVCIFRREEADLPRDGDPGEGKTKQSEAQLEQVPTPVRELTARFFRRKCRRSGHVGCVWSWDLLFSVGEKSLAHCESAVAGVGSTFTIRQSQSRPHGHGCRALRVASLPDRSKGWDRMEQR